MPDLFIDPAERLPDFAPTLPNFAVGGSGRRIDDRRQIPQAGRTGRPHGQIRRQDHHRRADRRPPTGLLGGVDPRPGRRENPGRRPGRRIPGMVQNLTRSPKNAKNPGREFASRPGSAYPWLGGVDRTPGTSIPPNSGSSLQNGPRFPPSQGSRGPFWRFRMPRQSTSDPRASAPRSAGRAPW